MVTIVFTAYDNILTTRLQKRQRWTQAEIKLILDPWREWLKEQRESGNYNASRIWWEMVARGFTGSEIIVRDVVAKWRKDWIPPVTTAARLPSVPRVSRWLMPWRITRDEENYASRFISLMCEKEPELKIAQQLVLEFYRILKT